MTSRCYEIKTEAVHGGPFYRPLRVGGAVWLYLNTEHRFYKEVYRGPESTPRLRGTLEVLLFVLGASEVHATEALEEFYKKERGLWSTRLDTALNLLNRRHPVEDAQEAKDAEQEDAEAEAGVMAGVTDA